MKKLGFSQFLYNSALYFNSQETYVTVYVNDLHIFGPNFSLINKLKMQLAFKFKTIDLDSIAHYLYIEIFREYNTIIVTQTVYINQFLDTHQIFNCNPLSIPMIKGTCLASAPKNFLLNAIDVLAYKQFTGSIQWLACQTRFDIFLTVSKLSHQNIKPTN